MRRYVFRVNKRGSAIILLTLILVSMTSAVILMATDAKQKAEESYARTMIDIACRSMLAEYDIRLKEDYGIFAFRGNNSYVEEKVGYYIRYARKHSDTIFSLENRGIEADISDYALTDIDLFEVQLVDAVKYGFLNTSSQYSDNGSAMVKHYDSVVKTNADAVGAAFSKDNLPSKKYRNNGLDINLKGLTGEGIRGLLTGSGKNLAINSYIFKVFGNYSQESRAEKTYYNYEAEYIIAGRDSDIENLNKVKQYFIALRTPINIAAIYADPIRSAQALAEAEAMTPGPAAQATQLAIITAWAIEDAEEEWHRLLAGEEVDGFSYSDYIAVFLILQKRELKLLRIMDLIQLNLGLSYYEDFLMCEHVCGFSISVNLGGKVYDYEHRY